MIDIAALALTTMASPAMMIRKPEEGTVEIVHRRPAPTVIDINTIIDQIKAESFSSLTYGTKLESDRNEEDLIYVKPLRTVTLRAPLKVIGKGRMPAVNDDELIFFDE